MKFWVFIGIFLFCTGSFCAAQQSANITASRKNPLSYAKLRAKWSEVLVSKNIKITDAASRKKLEDIVARAKGVWSSFQNGAARKDSNYLWLDLKSTTQSSQIADGYKRLKDLAIAYQTATNTNPYYHNDSLKKDIVDGLDWMYQNRYYIRQPYNNWFEWELGALWL